MSTDGAAPCVLAIDFDGPCCDSRPGVQSSAWRAARALWPDVMEAAAEVPLRKTGARGAWVGRNWAELEGVTDAGQPAWLRAKMQQLWPVCAREEDCVLLMRLCADEAIASGRSARGSRPLTVGEIAASWDADLRDALLYRYDARSSALTQACDEESARWLEEDREGWARAHALHPAAADLLRQAAAGTRALICCASRSNPAVIQRSAVQPTHRGAPSVGAARLQPAPRVYRRALICGNRGRAREVLRHSGIEGMGSMPLIEAASRREKVEALVTLAHEHPSGELSFVDDDAQMLRCASSDVRLLRWNPLFAGWGYSTPAQAALVARMPRVRVLDDAAELRKLC